MASIAKHGRKVNRSGGGNATIIIILFLMGIMMVVPLFYTVIQSLKPLEELFVYPPRFYVVNPTFDNFTMLFTLTSNLWVPFSRYLFNSLFISILCTALQVILASMAAYPLAKHEFPGRKFFFSLITVALLFTGDVTFIPQYIIISSMKLINTYWALILPSLAYVYGLYLMRQNMIDFPPDIIEAARIDGASEYKIFWSIVMPSMKPVWLTLVIFSFNGLWGRSDTAFIYNESLKGLPTVLSQLAAGGIARAGVGAAVGLVMIIPPILTFIIAQSNVMEAMANAGMKD